MNNTRRRATIKMTELRVLIKMWIYYCSDNKKADEERIQNLIDTYSVGWFLQELDKYITNINCKK